MKKLFILRHGETLDNLRGICQGQTPGELSPKGRYEAQLAAQHLRNVALDRAITSDLKRAIDTAEEIVKVHPKLKLELDERLRERYLGVLQGQSLTKLEVSEAELLLEGVEPWEDLLARVALLLRELEEAREEQILLVSHGVTIRALLSLCGIALEDDRPLAIANASLTTLGYRAGRWELLELNDTSYLEL